MTTERDGRTVNIPNGRRRERSERELTTLTLTDLELEEQSDQVRGGDPCCQGQHIPNPILELQR